MEKLLKSLPKGTSASVVTGENTREGLIAKAKKEGATLYDNDFEHQFEPWSSEKIQACVAVKIYF